MEKACCEPPCIYTVLIVKDTLNRTGKVPKRLYAVINISMVEPNTN